MSHWKTAIMDPLYNSSLVRALENHVCSPNTRIAGGLDKKYWTLEELKYLMRQRISLWIPEDQDGLSTQKSEPELFPQKRKHDAIEDAESISAGLPTKMRVVSQPSRGLYGNLSGGNTSPQNACLSPCSLLARSINGPICEGSLDYNPIDHALEGPISQPQRPCLDMASTFMHRDYETLFSRAFDAAYEAIMRSEWDPMYLTPESPRTGDSTLGYHNDGIGPVLQYPQKWELRCEEASYPSHLGQESLPPHRSQRQLAPEMTQTRKMGGHPLFLGDSYAGHGLRLSIESESALGLRQSFEQRNLEAEQHNFDIGPLREFWSSNKLY
ncbi:hypothetical protein BJY01DRAFT_213015 [Aspergillus pseudoustus]|uniref:Fork-head domain-containing protein n=1 Tax=Aspergillus pseudoustus TaxID=1810923 RepID=A0ABR4K3R7_9EURO